MLDQQLAESEYEVEQPGERGADNDRLRSMLYRLTASVFIAEPTAESLTALFDVARDQGKKVSRWEKELLHCVGAYSGIEIAVALTEIRTEYAELFLGPRPPLAPPYESLYIGYPNRLFTDVTRQVRRVYEENGFEVVKRNRVPDDHLGFELEFMARLAAECAEDLELNAIDAARKSLELQKTFLSDHLARWLPLFYERVKDAQCSPYYEAWAKFTMHIVDDDMRYLSLPVRS